MLTLLRRLTRRQPTMDRTQAEASVIVWLASAQALRTIDDDERSAYSA